MRNQKGFTLIEIILVAGIAVIIGTLLVVVLVNNSGMYYQENSTVTSGIGLNDVMDELSTDIKQAAAVVSGYPEASPNFTSGAETLILKLPALSASGNIPDVYDYLVISKDGTNPKILRKYIFPDPQSTRSAVDQVLTTMLDSIQFSYLDKSGNTVSPDVATSVGTTIKLLSKTGSVGSSKSATIMTTLRNMQ